jgi:hypothetical protein
MTKQELIEAAYEMIAGNVADLSIEQLRRLMTVTQYVTDLCLNEIEGRGELTSTRDMPIVPYMSDYSLDTILTRRVER